jgi:hypothetical protein
MEKVMDLYQEIFNERDYVWVGFDNKYQDYLVQGFRRVDGGVKHFVGRYKQARLETIYHDLDRAYFSKRPFQLGQGCDGSGDECCFALFHHFCLIPIRESESNSHVREVGHGLDLIW